MTEEASYEITDNFSAIIHAPEGVISFPDFQDYIEVITDALNVHLDREKIRQGLWKQYPAVDQCNQIKVKSDRVSRSLEKMTIGKETFPVLKAMRDNAIEELLDIINYANFAARILEGKVAP